MTAVYTSQWRVNEMVIGDLHIWMCDGGGGVGIGEQQDELTIIKWAMCFTKGVVLVSINIMTFFFFIKTKHPLSYEWVINRL
jgi:hypothetical protein